MRLLRSPFGAATILLLLGLGVGCGFALVRVDRATRPARQDQVALDFESMLMRVQQIQFPAADGLTLSGWMFNGDPRKPTVVLCHDNGSNKSALLNLAIALRKSGFSLLLFDFRGHGESEGGRSTMGILEKRDILGAVDYLVQRSDRTAGRVGVYGVGTGAHAAVLAAIDRPRLQVLVLDRLYPDAGFALSRVVFEDWDFATRHLGFLPRGLFAVLSGTAASSDRAADGIAALIGRDLLLLAPEDDEELGAAMRTMYETIPDQIDVDGNLVFLPVTQGAGLFGEARARYHETVVEFFESRLMKSDGDAQTVDGEPDAFSDIAEQPFASGTGTP